MSATPGRTSDQESSRAHDQGAPASPAADRTGSGSGDDRRRAPRSRTSVGGAVGVAFVLVLTGAMFAANARLAGGVEARQPQDLTALVQSELDRTEALEAEVDALAAEIEALTDEQVTPVPADDAEAAGVALAAGRVPVDGPGLTVRLSDAPTNVPKPSWATNDDLVVHQQDLQAVINALWSAGAEAMTLQGQRVISTSAFRCVGNVLWLHGQVFSPPYVVTAIGDPDVLRDTLETDPKIEEYLRYVDALGLGWSVTQEQALALPAYEGTLELQHAEVPDGVAVPGVAP